MMKTYSIIVIIVAVSLLSLSTVGETGRWTEYSAKVTGKSHTDKMYYISVEVQGYSITGTPYKTELSVTPVYYGKVVLSSQIPVEEKDGDWRTVQGYLGEPTNKTKVRTADFTFISCLVAVMIALMIVLVVTKKHTELE
jgi:predicted nucleic acid-binding Zn ribbon protein